MTTITKKVDIAFKYGTSEKFRKEVATGVEDCKELIVDSMRGFPAVDVAYMIVALRTVADDLEACAMDMKNVEKVNSAVNATLQIYTEEQLRK